MENKFNIGDRVITKGSQWLCAPDGLTGTVKYCFVNTIGDYDIVYAIEFDKPLLNSYGKMLGESCGHRCKPGYGYWLYENELEKIE